MRTIETISVEMRGIVDGAEGRNLSDEEMSHYEALETELSNVRRDSEIRSRQRAYQTPVSLEGNVVIRDAQDADEQTRAFESYLRTGVANQDITQLRAQSTSDSAGGYLIPDGFRHKLIEVQKSYGGVAQFATEIRTSTGSALSWPVLDDTANTSAIKAEGSAVGSGGADLAFSEVSLGSYLYSTSGTGNAPLKVSIEFLRDSAFDVVGLVSRTMATRLGRAQAVHFATGSGSGQPDGIIRADLTADVKQATSNTFTYAELMAVEDGLDPVYRMGARWVCNSKAWSKIRQIVDTAGRPLVEPSAQAGIGGAPLYSLLGYPVTIDQSFPDAADDTPFMFLGNVEQAYIVRRVGNIVIAANPYSSMGTGQIEYSAYESVDATMQNRRAISVLAGKDS